MSTYVPDAVQAGLDQARVKKMKQSSKLRIETEDGYFRVRTVFDEFFGELFSFA